MELEKCHLLFGCEIMKFFSTGLLLLIVFGSLEGSTIPHKRTVRALNATIQTHFNGTIQRRNPCTNHEVERSSYRGCHEFHHHSKESNWSDYSRKCAALISDFFHAISNLVTFKDRQSGTFDLNINTKVSHKTDGACADTKKPICPTPTVIVESKDYEILPSTHRDDLPRKDAHSKGSEICSVEEAVKVDEEEEEKCSVGSEASVNEETQTADISSVPGNNNCLDIPDGGKKIPESSDKTIPALQPEQKVNLPEIKHQSEIFQPETIPTYDNYPSSDLTPETTNIESSTSNTYDVKSTPITVQPDSTVQASSTVITSAPKEDLYIDAGETSQQSTGNDSAGQETPSDSKDYLSDYTSQANEEKTETQSSSSDTQSENDKVVSEYAGPSIEFSDKLALYNVHEPQQKSFQTFSPTTQHYFSDTTTPSTFEIKSDYDTHDTTVNTQATSTPQYQSESYDEQMQPSQAVTFAPLQPEPENYVNQYDQVASDLSTSSPLKDKSTLELSDQLSVYNVRQPQLEYPSSSSLLNEPTSIQPSSLSQPQPENYVNYEDGLVSNQLPTSVSPPKGEEPSVEFSDQLAVYNVRQPYLEPTSIQPASSEHQPDNYDSYEDDTESNESITSSPSVNDEPSIEFSDQLAVYNIRAPTTAYPPSSVSLTETTSTPPSVSSETQTANYVNYEDEAVEKQSPTVLPSEEVKPSIEFSDQLAVYNVREPLPGTTTPSPLVTSSIQSSAPQSDYYMNYENDDVSNQTPTSPSPQHGEEQNVEYSDQLAVYNVREPLPSTTTSSPAVNEDIQSTFGTTLPPQFVSYELDTYDDKKTEIEPQSTPAPEFEEKTYHFQPVTSQPQPSDEPGTDYYAEYNAQTNQMSPFTTPAGNIYPTMMPSSEYIDNNGPVSPSSDYSYSEGTGGFVSTSLPSSSDDTSSFNNYELQYDSQPTPTQLPYEAQQDQVFSGQVSDVREPQSDSSVTDGLISDVVTAISPIAQSESSNHEDESSLTDYQQIVPSESKTDTSVTNEYPDSSSPNQPLPKSYDIYDEPSSTSENEAQMISVNEPTTYPQLPSDVITTIPPSTEPENFGIYDESQFLTEPQSTYPPKTENESFANYEDNNTSITGQDSVSIQPLSDSSETESISSEEGSSSEEDGNEAVSNDQGLLPLSPNTFRPPVQIETTVNYADQTPFRPIRLPSSFGPLQENNIIYDEGILGNETEPSTLGGEEANNFLNVSSELTKQNEGKEFDSPTTRTPELEFDTYYEETFKQPSSSDSPKINNYMTYEDDIQPSSPKFDLNTATSKEYSPSFFPSTPSFTQEIITTPSTTEAKPETYTDYEYSKTDFNSQTTFPPQTESVTYDDHSSKDQQQQSVSYPAYDNQIQSTSIASPPDQEMIEFTDQLSIYNVPETALESSLPLSELISSNMITTTQSTIPSDRESLEIELEPTFSPPVEPQTYDEKTLPSKDLNLDTYINYEDTIPSSQLPTTTLPPNEVEPSLKYSDQFAVYNVRQPQLEYPSSSSLLNEPTSIQPSSLSQPQPENYLNYEDGLVSNQLPTSVSPPKGEEPSVEFSDQLAVYNVRKPYLEPTSIQPASSELQPNNYDSYEDETESNESITSSPSVNAEPSLEYSDEVATYNVQSPLQFSSPSPQIDENIVTISTSPPSSVYKPVSGKTASPGAESENEELYEDEILSNNSPSTHSPPKEEPSIEFSDQLAIYNVREPSTTSPLPYVSSVQSTSTQPSTAPEPQPENYVSYEDEKPSNQIPTTSSPRHEEDQYLEYSDQLAVYNVREPLPGTTTPSPLVTSSIQSSSPQSDNYMNYENDVVSNQTPTSPSPQHGEEQYVEYSDQLAVYNVREPLLSSTTTSSPPVDEDIPSSFGTTLPPLFSSNRIETYDDKTVGNELQPTVAPVTYDEPTSASASSLSPSETQSENYVNYETEELVTPSSSPKSVDSFLEYSDQLSVYNVRQPEHYSSSPSPVNENLVTTTAPVEYTDSQPTLAPESEPQVYDELASFPPFSASQPDVYTSYDDKIVSNEYPTSPYPPHEVEPSLQSNSQLVSSSVAPSSSSPIEEAPFLQYSDQLSIYNDRQPDFENTPPSPSEIENVSSGAISVSTMMPLPSGDSFQDYNSPVTSSDYVSSPSFQAVPDNQVTYEDDTVPKEGLSSTSSTFNLAPSQDYSVPPSNYDAGQEVDHHLTPSQSQDNYIAYEDQTVSYAQTTPSLVTEVEPSLEYSDQLAIYNVREPIVTSTAAPVVSENIPSRITTLPPASLIHELTSPQPFSSEFESDSDDDYEDETGSNEPATTLSPPTQTEPFVESSDQLAAFNVLGPVIVPISASVDDENVSSGDVTTSLPSESDDDEDYEDETVSTPSPVTGYEPSLEVSDELSIYNVRQRPSEMTTPSPLSENIPSGAVTTFGPSFPSDKFESYDYQPVGFESTFSSKDESQVYNPSTSVPNTPSQSQDSYVNYENEIESNKPMTTLRPSVDVEYSDELAVYDVRSPSTTFSSPSALFNENTAVNTVSTFMPTPVYDEPTSVPSTTPEEQPDTYISYEDQLASDKYPPTYSPTKEKPAMITSEQLSINTTSAQSLPSDAYDYNSHVEYTDYTTAFPSQTTNEPTSIRPLHSVEPQPDQYVNYEEETTSTSTSLSTSTSPPTQVEPSVEYSDQLDVDNVREPLFESTSPPVVSQNIPSSVVTTPSPSSSNLQSNSYIYEDYKDETVSKGPSSTFSTPVQVEPSSEYSDQLAVYNVRGPDYSSSSPSPFNENYSNEVVTTAAAPSLPSDGFGTYDSQVLYTDFQPTSSPQSDSQIYDEPKFVPVSSESQPDNYVNYEDKIVSNQVSSSPSTPAQVEPSVEYSDQLSVYNVREPLLEPTSPPVVATAVPTSPLSVQPISILPSSSESPSDSDDDEYEDETESNESSTTLSTPVQLQVEPSVEYSNELAVYNVRQPISEPSSPSVVSQNIDSSVVTTLSPSSDTESDNDEEYDDETVSTPSPVTGYEPSLEVSDELSIYNVRQRPSEMTTPSPFNNNVLSNLMTTISPFFTFKESSKDNLSTTSQTTVFPEYESDGYDEESFIQPSQSNEATSKDFLPETLSNSDEQTISNVIQSTQSPDLSNQLLGKNEIEFQEVSFTTAPPNVESSVISEPSAPQEFDNRPILSPDFETHEETMTTPPSRQTQDQYVVYEDQTLSNELTTYSPVKEVKPSLEYSNQFDIDNTLPYETSASYSTSTPPSYDVVTETYTDYEGSTAVSEPPSTLYDEPKIPGQVQTSTLQPQIVNYDYYNDQSQRPEESSVLPPTTEIETKITLTEVGPTLPPNFESQIFDKPNPTQQDNYVDYEDSTLPKKTPTSPSPQSNIQPLKELSDDLAVYNAGKTYFEPTSIQPSSSELQPDSNVTYKDEVIVNELSTPSPPQKVENTASQTTSVQEGETQIYDEPTSSLAVSYEPQPENYVSYEDEKPSNQIPTTSSPRHEEDQYLEYSDQLAVYNVREPLPGTTTPSPLVTSSIQPTASQSDNYMNYENDVVSNQTPTSPSPQHGEEQYVEYSDQLAVYNVREPLLSSTTTSSPPVDEDIPLFELTSPPVVNQNIPSSVVTTLSPSSSLNVEPISIEPSYSESPSDSDDDEYEDETESNESSTTLSTPVQMQVEPSVEYSNELAVYNVRQPISEPTSPPVVSQNIANSVATTLPPPSLSAEPIPVQPSSSESQSDSDDDEYEDESVTDEFTTTLSTPVQVQVTPSVEYSDELAVYNVRQPISEPTSPPVVSQNIANSVVTTLSPSSDTEPDNDEEYDDETVSTPSPVTGYEPSLDVSDELSIYNVRQRPSEMTTPSPFNNNVLSKLMTTISPYFKPSSNDYEGSTFHPSVINEAEPEIYDQPYSTSLPSSQSASNYVDSEEGMTSYDYSTPSSPQIQAEQSWSSNTPFEYPDQLSGYNFPQRPSKLSSSSLFIENLSDVVVTTPAPSLSSNDFGPYNTQNDQNDEPNVSPGVELKNSEDSVSIQNFSPASQPENYVSYEDESASNGLPTSLSPPTDGEPSIEFSDQLAIYNVREPSTTSPLPYVSSVQSTSTQPSTAPEPQPDNYVSYEDEKPSNQIPTTSSPRHEEDQYLEYSDQLAVYNVREPLPGTTTVSPLVTSSIQPTAPQSDNYMNYENDVVSNQTPTSPSPQHGEEQYVEYSDQLAVYNVREPLLSSTTTSSPPVNEDIASSVVTTSLPFYESDAKTTQLSFDSQPGSYQDYEGELLTTVPSYQGIKTSFSNTLVTTTAPSLPSDEYKTYDNEDEGSDSTTIVRTELPPQTTGPLPSSEPQPEQYVNYEDETVSTPLSTSTSPPTQIEPSVEYSDQLDVDNVREPLFEPTSPPVVSQNIPSSVVTTLSPSSSLSVEPISIEPSYSESPSDSDDDEYEDETESNESSTTLSTPVQLQVEPSVEYSNELAVYNVRQPISEPTSPPVVSQNIANSVATTLPPPSLSAEPIPVQPSSSESQSDSDDDEYEDESVTDEFTTTLSTPVQVQVTPSVEYSDELAVYNVRQPISEPTSPPVVSQNIPRIVVTTLSPSSSNIESGNYIYEDYKDETVSNGPSSTLSTPATVEPSVEYSDQLAIYNVHQPKYLTSPSPLTENFENDLVTTAAPSLEPGVSETYDNQVVYNDFQPTSSPQSDSQIYDESTSIPTSSSDYYVNYEDKTASNVFTTLSPLTQSSVKPEQDDFYAYDDRTKSSDSRTFSTEAETEYDEEATPLEPQSPSTQPFLETTITTFQPRTEPQINKPENKTTTPLKHQEVSTFSPFYPSNQPSYSLPGESKLVSEQQDQVISTQVVNSPPVPSSELNSDNQSNNFSNLVKSQETRLTDGVENARHGTLQPEPFALVPDQINPSNEPGEDYVSCTCTRGNKRATQHTVMCPFNPVLKGNMTAPSYYILISKLSGGSDNQSQPDEESFQVEKVYLGDGTPLNCTDERKPFPTSKYTPVPISSSRTVKLPIRLNNA